jgi:hypothetical protein
LLLRKTFYSLFPAQKTLLSGEVPEHNTIQNTFHLLARHSGSKARRESKETCLPEQKTKLSRCLPGRKPRKQWGLSTIIIVKMVCFVVSRKTKNL